MGQVLARSASDPCRLAHTPAGGEKDYFIGSEVLAAEPNFEPSYFVVGRTLAALDNFRYWELRERLD